MTDFERQIIDLLQRPEFKKLEHRARHHFTRNRLQHSLLTAKIAYRTAKILRANVRVTVRAALLHDWYFEARDEHRNRLGANVHHYRISAANTSGIGEARPVIDAVRTHMWPYGRRQPQTVEAWIVWMTDNIAWGIEALMSFMTYLRKKIRFFMYGPPLPRMWYAV